MFLPGTVNTDKEDSQMQKENLKRKARKWAAVGCVLAGFTVSAAATPAQAADAPKQGSKPNIVVIMGDDIGIWNIGAYHRGMMAGQDAEPRQDRQRRHAVHRLLRRGELHGRPRQLHHRRAADPHGHDHGRPGRRPVGLPAEALTIATALKSMGYATGQFGKNHLGDLNEFLPTVHGFDEFFGYLYHLDAMEDPAHPAYPQESAGQSRSAQHGPLLGDGQG